LDQVGEDDDWDDLEFLDGNKWGYKEVEQDVAVDSITI